MVQKKKNCESENVIANRRHMRATENMKSLFCMTTEGSSSHLKVYNLKGTTKWALGKGLDIKFRRQNQKCLNNYIAVG